MSQACRSSSARMTRIDRSNNPGPSEPNGICSELPFSRMDAQVQMNALEFRVRTAQSLDERVAALSDYAMTALLSGIFWQKGSDGTPLSHLIFDDRDIAALVGKKIFTACQIIDDLDDAIRVQMGAVLAEHWKLLTLTGVESDGGPVRISAVAKELSVAGGAANN